MHELVQFINVFKEQIDVSGVFSESLNKALMEVETAAYVDQINDLVKLIETTPPEELYMLSPKYVAPKAFFAMFLEGLKLGAMYGDRLLDMAGILYCYDDDSITIDSKSNGFKAFGYLLRAEMPIISVLDLLLDEVSDEALKDFFSSAKEGIMEGKSLAMAMKQLKAFSDEEIRLIEEGEQSGQLPEACFKF